MKKTLIIGLGNTLRKDDGIGPRVVQDLANHDLPKDVEIIDGGTRGLELVTLLEGRQRVIVIDAAEIGKKPGEIERFSLGEARLLDAGRQISVHSAGLGDALLLADALGVLPQAVVIYGIQPASLDWDPELSPELEQVIPRVVESILDELKTSAALL
jgi:hydrogenase maturation protease